MTFISLSSFTIHFPNLWRYNILGLPTCFHTHLIVLSFQFHSGFHFLIKKQSPTRKCITALHKNWKIRYFHSIKRPIIFTLNSTIWWLAYLYIYIAVYLNSSSWPWQHCKKLWCLLDIRTNLNLIEYNTNINYFGNPSIV